MANPLPVKQGLSANSLRNIPTDWNPVWFRRFIVDHLQNADVRNSLNNVGVTVSGVETQNPTLKTGGVPLSSLAAQAAFTVVANNTGASASPTAISEAALTTMVQTFTRSLNGSVPAPGGAATVRFLREDGTWAQVITNSILATTTNDSAGAGILGEFATATVASGSAVVLGTGVTSNVTSVSLTAGDWDVSGAVDYVFAATTSYTQLQAGISLTSATLASQAGGAGLGTDPNVSFATPAAVPTALPYTQTVPTVRISLAVTTTVFLVSQAVFTVAALSAFGTIRARRVR